MKEYKESNKKYTFPEKITRTLKYAWREKYLDRLNDYLSDDDNFYVSSYPNVVNEWLNLKNSMLQSEAVAAYFIEEQVNEIKKLMKEEFVVRMSNEEVLEKSLEDDAAENAVFKYLGIVDFLEFEYDNKNGFKETIVVSDYLKLLVTRVFFDSDDFPEKRDTLKREIQDLFRAVVINYKINYEQKMFKKIERSKGEILEFLILNK